MPDQDELAAMRVEVAALRAEVALLRAQQAGHVCTPSSQWFPNAAAACTCGTTSAVCPVHPVMRMPTIWCSQQNYLNGCAGGAPMAYTVPSDKPLEIMRSIAPGAAGAPATVIMNWPAQP